MKPVISFDYSKAWQYALQRLETELPAMLSYHAVFHTRDDVVPATANLASLEKISGIDRYLLLTAAWYHDLGYIEQHNDHEITSANIAMAVLPNYGYSSAEIQIIFDIIMATRIPQSPQTHLERIMADADLDSLGRDDFWQLSLNLKAELASLGRALTDEEWHRNQLAFLQNHSYFTRSAKKLRDPGKQKNIAFLESQLKSDSR